MSYIGSIQIGKMFYGSTEIKEAWLWSGAAWQKVFSGADPVSSMGLYKTSDQSGVAGNTWTQVTLVADPNYPGTVVSNSGIVVVGEGPCVIAAAVPWVSSFGSQQCRIKINGSVVWTSAVAASPSGSTGASVVAGDVVTLETFTTATFGGTVAAAGTYLRIAAA